MFFQLFFFFFQPPFFFFFYFLNGPVTFPISYIGSDNVLGGEIALADAQKMREGIELGDVIETEKKGLDAPLTLEPFVGVGAAGVSGRF